MNRAVRATGVLIMALLLVLALAVPATAHHNEDHDKGGGNDNAGGGSSGDGNPSSGSQGGGSDRGNGGSNGASPSNGGASPSNNGQSGGTPSGSGSGSSQGQGAQPDHTPAAEAEQAAPGSSADHSHPDAVPPHATTDSEPTSGPSNGGGSDPPAPLVGFFVDSVESAGSVLKAIESRSDMAELMSTDMDSPIVSGAMVLMTIGILGGLYGMVRTTQGVVKQRRMPSSTSQAEEVAKHLEAATAAGLSAAKWAGLELTTYRKLFGMDAHTVAFWMGSDVAAVKRWQAGRTLADDIQDGIITPDAGQDDSAWETPTATRRHVPDVDAEPLPVAAD